MKLTDAQARDAIDKWAQILKLNPIFTYFVKVNNAPDHNVKKSKRAGVQAEIKVDEAYHNVALTINAYEFDAAMLDHVICHELIHVVLARISTLTEEAYGERHKGTAINLIESITEQLAQAFMAVMPKSPPKTKSKKRSK